MPQISKGHRTQVSARIEQPYFEKLDRYLSLTGESKNDFVRELIIERLNQVDLESLERNQEPLPLTA